MDNENMFQILNARLTRDPELKYTPTQLASCNLTVAKDRTVKNKEGKEEKKTYFLRFTIFGKQAEALADYSAKGKRVNIYGHFESTNKTDSEGNNKTYENKVVDRIVFIDFKDRPKETPKEPEPPAFTELEADIPF